MSLRRSHGTPVERRIGPVAPRAMASSAVMTPTPWSRARKMGWPVSSSSYSSSRGAHRSSTRSTPSRQPSGRSAATPPGRMKLWFIRSPVIISSSRSVSSRSRQPNSIIDTAPRSRPLVARNSRCDDIRFSSQSSMRIHCARGGMSLVDAEQRLGREREHQLVEERRGVVHAGHVGGALEVGERLARLLHARVQVTDDRLAAQHRLAVELQHEPEHAVRGRVLRAHVEDHRLVLGELLVGQGRHLGLGHPQHRADLAHQLGGARALARRELLGSLVRPGGGVAGDGCHGVTPHHLAFCTPLNCTGIAPTG